MAGEVAPADKITLSGVAATLQLGGTLVVTGIDRDANDFFASDATRTIVDNPAGAIGDTPSASGFTFDAVTPDPTDDEVSHHIGQGAFLQEIDYVKAQVGPGTTRIDAKLFIALGGDADGDGQVWLSDWAALRANFSNTGTGKTWIDGNFDPWENDEVWLSDWAALRANFGNANYATPGVGAAAAVPEPGTIAMLLAGLLGLALLARRHRAG